MKSLKLSVTIYGGNSQLGIFYKLVKLGSVPPESVKEKQSFEKVFNNLDGEYILYIGGTNADSENRKTVIKLTYDESQIEMDKTLSYANPSTQKGKHIYAEYYFKAQTHEK